MMTMIPRSHERGPIEAFRSSWSLSKWSMIPRSHERGPIEASWTNSVAVYAGRIPRSHERGPIEACYSLSRRAGGLHDSALSRARPH